MLSSSICCQHSTARRNQPAENSNASTSPSAFEPSLEYSADNVVLFWQPPSYFRSGPLRRFFVVDGLSYSCAEQFMMAEKVRLFKDHRAVELIMSPDPTTHKRLGRGVRNFDSAVSVRDNENVVLSGNYAKFTQNPAMKHQLSSTGNKHLGEASPLDPVWGIGLQLDDPRAIDPRQWRGKNLLGEALFAVRKAIRDSETGLAHPASAGRFCTSTGNAGIHQISSAPPSCSLTTASACQGPPSEFRSNSRTCRPTKARNFWR